MLEKFKLKNQNEHPFFATFPSSNNRVSIIIDWIRNCHIIRIKSCKVISVGARRFLILPSTSNKSVNKPWAAIYSLFVLNPSI